MPSGMTEPVDPRVVDPAPGASHASRDEWVAAGRELLASQSSASWTFADWLAAGHSAWGEEAMREAAESTGASAGKISHYLTTARAYPPLRRRNSLTFSHHLEVARLPDAEAETILNRADAEGWSRSQTRAAAREASLEGKVARQRREIAQLKRALRAAQTDARDAAAQAGARVSATRRLIKDEMTRVADVVEELAEPGGLDGLHGNARRALARRIVTLCTAMVADVNAANARIGAAVTRIEGAPK